MLHRDEVAETGATEKPDKMTNNNQKNKKKKKIKAREPPPAPPLNIVVSSGSSAKVSTDAEIIQQCRQDVQKLTKDMLLDSGAVEVDVPDAHSPATIEAHCQSLLAFSIAQVELAHQTYRFIEQSTHHAETAVEKAETLKQATDFANNNLATDLVQAQLEIEKVSVAQSMLTNLVARTETAHQTAQSIIPTVQSNFNNTAALIAEADVEYKTARDALESELQDLETRQASLDQQAATGSISAERLAAEKQRISHEQADVLTNLGELSAQRLQTARDLLDSVKAFAEPGMASEQANITEECVAQSGEALQTMNDAKLWFETAAQRIAQATAAKAHTAAAGSLREEIMSGAAAEERIECLAAQLHTCFVALEWVKTEAAKYDLTLPATEESLSVSQSDAELTVQRGVAASKCLSEYAHGVVTLSPKTVSGADQFYSYLETVLAAHTQSTQAAAQINLAAQETSQFAEQAERWAADYTTAAEDAVYMIETQAALDYEQATAAEEEHPPMLSSSARRNPRSSLGTFQGGRCLSTSSIYMPPDEEEVGFLEVNPFVNASPKRVMRKAASGLAVEGTMSPLSARHKAQKLVIAARVADERAEELAVEVEKIAAVLQESACVAERAASAAELAAAGLDAELLAMAEFKSRADAVSAGAQSALQATSQAANGLDELKVSLLASVLADDEAYEAEREVIQREKDDLESKMIAAKTQWESENATEGVRLSRRADYSKQLADLMERQHAIAVRRKILAEEHLAKLRILVNEASVQDKASKTAEISAEAQNLRDNFRTTEAAISAAQSSSQDAEKVNAAAELAIEAKVNVRVAVAAAETAALAAAAATTEALAAIAEYEALGEIFPDKGFYSEDVVVGRTQRCEGALQVVDSLADKIIASQSSAQQASQHAATKCGQTVAARAVGYIALARASEAGQEAAKTAARASEVQAEIILTAESALTKCHADVSEAREEMERAQGSASEAERLRVEQAQREEAALRLAAQRAAVNNAKQAIEAAEQAEAHLQELKFEAERMAQSIEQTVVETQQAISTTENALVAIANGLVTMKKGVAESAVINSSINEARLQASLLARACKEFQQESDVFITEADEAFAREHSEIEREAIELDDVLDDAAQRWQQDNYSAVQKAAERLPLAVEGAVLMQQMHEAAVRKHSGIHSHLTQASSRTETDDAVVKEAAALLSAQEAAEIRQISIAAYENATEAATAAKLTAEQIAAAAERVTEEKAAVKATLEAAERAAEVLAARVTAAREAVQECEKVGIEAPGCSVQWEDSPSKQVKLVPTVLRRVTEAVDQVMSRNDVAQTTAAQVFTDFAQLAEVKAELDSNLSSVLTNYDQIAADAAAAQEAHNATVDNAKAALERAQADVQSSTQAKEESCFAVADAESVFFEALIAQKVKQEAELLVKQQAAQTRVFELLETLKSADLEAEKTTSALEALANSQAEIVESVQDMVATAKMSRDYVNSQVLLQEEYQRRAEELSAAAENAVLSATLEANVAEEHREASAKQIAAADEVLMTARREVDSELLSLGETISEAETRWETEGTAETVRAEERVSFAAKRAELMSKLLLAAERREVVAAEHVELTKSHTEAVDALQKASQASAAAQSASELQANSRFNECMTSAGQAGARLQDDSLAATVRAGEVEADVKRARVAALESAVWYAQTQDNVAAAIAMCVELGATAPELVANSAEMVSKRDVRCGEAVRRAQECIDQIAALHEVVKIATSESTSAWGKAVAAQALGDMAVTHVEEAAQDADREAERAQSAHSDTVSVAEAALIRCRNEAKTAGEDVECAKIAVGLAERTCLTVQEQKAHADAEHLRLQQQTARNTALELLKATKAVEMNAEEMSFEIERIALTLEHTVQLAEEAAALAAKSESLVEGECAAMEKFANKTSEYKPIVDQALECVVELEERCSALAVESTESISEANGTYAGARNTFEQEAIHLHDAIESYEEQWARDNVPLAQQAAQRVAFALENAGLMLELFDAAVSRQYQAVAHVNLVRGYKESAEAQEQASIASSAAFKATDEQTRAHSLETAVSAVKTSDLAAEKVKSALRTAASVEKDVAAKVEKVLLAELEASQVAATAKASVLACVEMGADAPEFNVSKMEDTQRRAQRCNDAQHRVEACLTRLRELQTGTQKSVQQVTAQFENVTTFRATGEANVTYVLTVADKVNVAAGNVNARSDTMIRDAEEALAQCRAEASACGVMEENSRVAAENANLARVAAEHEENERLAMEAAELERSTAETLTVKRLAAEQKVAELTTAWRAADQHAEELSFVPETLSGSLEDYVRIAADAAATVVDAVAAANTDWTLTDEFRRRADDIHGIAAKALLAATTESQQTEGLCQALYQRIATADSDYLAEQALIDDELRVFDEGVDETELKWQIEDAPESVIMSKRATYAHNREEIVAKKVAIVTIREELAMDHVVEAGGISVEQAQPMVQIAQQAADSAHALETNAEFTHSATKAAEASRETAARSSTAAQQASQVREQVRQAIKDAAEAAQIAAGLAAELQRAVDECSRMGAAFTAPYLSSAVLLTQREERMHEAEQDVNETVDNILELDESVQTSVQQTISLSADTEAARTEGLQLIARTRDAAQHADEKVASVRALEVKLCADAENALVRARGEFKLARQAVVEARAAAAEAEKARLSAEEAEAQRDAAQLLRSARSLADLKVEKQRAAHALAKAAIEDATMAESMADERVQFVEELVESLTAIEHELEELSQQASAPMNAVQTSLTAVLEYRNQAESLFYIADHARTTVIAKATACEKNSAQSRSRVQAADETLAADRTALSEQISAFDATLAETEARWHTEGTPAMDRTAQRAVLAKDRARLVSRLSAAAAKRAMSVTEHVAWLQQQHEADAAQQKASVVVQTAAQARDLQLNVGSIDATLEASKTSETAAKKAAAAAQRAIELEKTFRAAVLSATKASKAAAQASTAASQTIVDCGDLGVDGLLYEAPSADAQSNRTQRCSEITEQALDCVDRIEMLNATTQRAAQKITSQCALIVRTKEEGDVFVTRTVEASSEVTVSAAKVADIERETLSMAEAALAQARAQAKTASDDGKAAHLAAILAVQAHNSAHEAESCCDTMSVGTMFTATSNATSEALFPFTDGGESSSEDLLRAFQEAMSTADENALAAERAAFALEHTLLAAEDAVMTVKGAVGVVHGELVSMEAYRTDLEKLNAAAEKARQAVSAEANAAQEKSDASVLRIKTADDALAAGRSVLDKTLSILNGRIAAAEAEWENLNTPEADRSTKRASFAQERADLLAKLAALLATREQKATEHLAIAKAHTELISAQKKASIAASSATVATNVQNETRTTEQASRSALTGTHADEKMLELCKQAAEARENVYLAVQKSAKAAKLYEKVARSASEKKVEVPVYDLARRAQRCSEAIKRADENAARIATLSSTVKQSAEQATAQCEQSIAARAQGDLAVQRAQEASREAAALVERVTEINRQMIAAAEESLSWARIQAQSAAKESQLASTEATMLQSSLTRSNLSTQEAAWATVNELLNAARAAASVAEEKTLQVENIASSIESFVCSAEEASMMSKGAVGLVHRELVYMEAYRKDAEAMAFIVTTPEVKGKKSPKEKQKQSAFVDSPYDTIAQRIHSADESFAKERAPLEKKVRALEETVAAAELRWRNAEEPEVTRATQRASFAQAKYKLLEKLSATAAARLVLAEKHVRYAKAQCDTGTHTSESNSGKSNSASVATDLQADTRTAENALQASSAGQSAAQRAVTAASKAAEAENQVIAAADAAKAATEKYLLAEKAARAAIVTYTATGIKVPEYDMSLTDEVSMRTQRRLQAVKKVTESADYIAMLNDSAQLSSTQASEQYTRTVKERARGDLAIARVINPSSAADLEMISLAEEALARCMAEAHAAETTAAQAKEASMSLRKSKVTLQSMSSRSNLGLFLKQEFGEVESHLVTGAVSHSPFSSSPAVPTRKSVSGPSEADDPNAGSKVDPSYVQPVVPEQGVHQAEVNMPEIWNLTGEALERHRAAQEEEKAQLARQVAPIKRAQIYEVRRLQSKKRSFHVKELRKKRVSTAADGSAEQLEDKIEQISNEVEEALFAAEADVNIIAEAGAALRDQVTWMQEFQSKAHSLLGATTETLANAKLFAASAEQNKLQSASQGKNLIHAASEHAHYGTQMRTWYSLELAHSAQKACESAEARVVRAGDLIEAHIEEAEVAIETILTMYSATIAPSPLAERAKSRAHNFSMSSMNSENTLSSLSDGEQHEEGDDENSFVRNAKDVRRVLKLAQEMMHIASTRSRKLLENATNAYQQTVQAHEEANRAVRESIETTSVTIHTVQQVSSLHAQSTDSAEQSKPESAESEVYHSPEIMVSHTPFRFSCKSSSGEISPVNSPSRLQQRFSADFMDEKEEEEEKMDLNEFKDDTSDVPINASIRSEMESVVEEKSTEIVDAVSSDAHKVVDVTLDVISGEKNDANSTVDVPAVSTNLSLSGTDASSPPSSVSNTPTHSAASTPAKQKDPKVKRRHSLMSNMLGGLFSGKKDKSGKSAASSPMPLSPLAPSQAQTVPTTPVRATPPVSPVRRNSIAGAVLSPVSPRPVEG